MAEITEADALTVLPLALMKDELRIPAAPGTTEHDQLLTGQILAAVTICARVTGRAPADLLPLRMAAVSIVRDAYDGYREISPNAARYAWLAPYRSYRVD